MTGAILEDISFLCPIWQVALRNGFPFLRIIRAEAFLRRKLDFFLVACLYASDHPLQSRQQLVSSLDELAKISNFKPGFAGNGDLVKERDIEPSMMRDGSAPTLCFQGSPRHVRKVTTATTAALFQ
jgi:hypothetical protein